MGQHIPRKRFGQHFLTDQSILQRIVDEMGMRAKDRIQAPPKMHDLEGFEEFLQKLKNQGVHPYLVGDFHMSNISRSARGHPSSGKGA